MIVYLTHWFRFSDKAKVTASLFAAVPAASLLGSVLAGWLLSVHLLGMAGWRWLFIIEGVPPVVLGIVTVFHLTDWERGWITQELEAEIAAKKKIVHTRSGRLFVTGASSCSSFRPFWRTSVRKPASFGFLRLSSDSPVCLLPKWLCWSPCQVSWELSGCYLTVDTRIGRVSADGMPAFPWSVREWLTF